MAPCAGRPLGGAVVNFLNDDGTLYIAEWAQRHTSDGWDSTPEWLDVELGREGQVPMYGTKAMADPLVSNGQLGVDLIRVPAGEGFAPHTHPGDHLLIVVGGRGTITYDGRIYPTSAGQVYLIEGAVPHAVGAVTDHAILAVGSPHRQPDAADRMTLTAYASVAADVGTLTCLECDATGRPDELKAIGCVHVPPEPGDGRPLVVGIAPAREDQPGPFVDTRSGDRLARLMGLDGSRELWRAVDATNLSPTPMDNWQRITRSVWRRLAEHVQTQMSDRVVVACGSTVARALAGDGEIPLIAGTASVIDVDEGKPALLVLIPHPSGLTRAWNDSAVTERCRMALQLARTFARCGSPRGCWTTADAAAFTAAVLAPGAAAEHG